MSHNGSPGAQVSLGDALVPVEDAQVPLRELAGEARRCGGHAAEALMGRVHQVALRYARVRLGRFGAEDLAQDVAQEVCMAVHTALPGYDERGAPFEAFVYAIASRKVADTQRTLIRGPRSVAEVPDGPDAGPGPEGQAVVRDEADRALALIRTLPPRQQEILTLRVAVGLTPEETGAALGMSAGSVRVTQHRALRRLRHLIDLEARMPRGRAGIPAGSRGKPAGCESERAS